MKKRYYLLSGATIYDGLEFHFKYVCERNKIMTNDEAEKEALEYYVHKDTGEELDSIFIDEISKKEYDVFRKYHL